MSKRSTAVDSVPQSGYCALSGTDTGTHRVLIGSVRGEIRQDDAGSAAGAAAERNAFVRTRAATGNEAQCALENCSSILIVYTRAVG